MVVHLHKLYDVDNKRSLHNSISWLFVCQKLSYLIEIWRSFEKNKLGHFLTHPLLTLKYVIINHIVYVFELKYLGVHVTTVKLLQFLVEHLRLTFYRMFNCIYSKSNAANCKMVTTEVLKSCCLPSMLYAIETTLLSAAKKCSCLWELYKQDIPFGASDTHFASDNSSFDYLWGCVKLDGIKQLTERKHCAFTKRLLGNCRFSNLLLIHVQNSILA